jgi:hypothetical protein
MYVCLSAGCHTGISEGKTGISRFIFGWGYTRGNRIVTFVKPWLLKQLLSHGFTKVTIEVTNCNLCEAMASETTLKPWLQKVTIEVTEL